MQTSGLGVARQVGIERIRAQFAEIVRINLNNGSALTSLANIALADISFNGAFESMATELERSGCKAAAYLLDRVPWDSRPHYS